MKAPIGHPRPRATGNQWLQREGESIFSKGEPPHKLSNPKLTALSTQEHI